MAKDKVELTITSKDETEKGLSSAKSKLSSWASSIGGVIKSAAIGVGAAAVGLGALIVSSIKKSMAGEEIERQLVKMTGSINGAKEVLRSLQDVSKNTGVSVEELAKGYQDLVEWSGEKLGLDQLKQLAQISTLGKSSFTELVASVGDFSLKLNEGEKSGERYFRAMVKNDLVSTKAAKTLFELSGRQKFTAESYKILTGEIADQAKEVEKLNKKYGETSATKFQKFVESINEAMKSFGGGLLGVARASLESLTTSISNLTKEGTFEAWGKKVAEILGVIYEKIMPVISAIGDLFSQDSNKMNAGLEKLKNTFIKLGEYLGEGILKGMIMPAAESITPDSVKEYFKNKAISTTTDMAGRQVSGIVGSFISGKKYDPKAIEETFKNRINNDTLNVNIVGIDESATNKLTAN